MSRSRSRTSRGATTPGTRCARVCLAGLSVTMVGVALAIPTVYLRAQTQTFRTPAAQVANVRFERAGAGIIRVQYDLLSEDADAVFAITLEVSQDGGQTFELKPRNVKGDIGPNVRPGSNKLIEWDASAEVDTLLVERFRFRVTPERVVLRPTQGVGTVIVRTTPPGASVRVDGQARGVTPLTISNIPAGKHQVLVARDGFLENNTEVDVTPSGMTTVDKQLTAAGPVPVSAQKTPGGGRPKWVIPAIAGGGAAGVAGIKLAGGSKRWWIEWRRANPAISRWRVAGTLASTSTRSDLADLPTASTPKS